MRFPLIVGLMILIDSSAWVEFDRSTGSVVNERLRDLISRGSDIAVSEPVLMEVLAGARSTGSAQTLEAVLTSFHWTPVEPATDFVAAASIYRVCRSAGVTVSGTVDCLIAAVAMRSGSSVLTVDRDFELIASVVPLQLDSYS